MSHIKTFAEKRRVVVKWKGEVIAETREAVRMEEGSYPPVFYVPRKDAKMDRLAPSAHRTHCPFKGDASYFSIRGGPENAVWSYEQPLHDVGLVKEKLAFYPDKVQISVSDD